MMKCRQFWGEVARLAGVGVASVLWCGAAVAALPERAAVVYSEWSGGSLANEYDGHLKKLGWAFDKYENVRLPELSTKLGNYRYVIATSVANYVKTVKMGPFAEAWRKWLADGGTLVVTDANYGSVLGDWVAAFGPGFESGSALCSAHTKPSDATRAITVRPDPLLSCPKPFRILLFHRPLTAEIGAAAADVRLQLSGHTHGGAFPVIHWLVARANEGHVRGLYEFAQGRFLYNSPGTGQWAGFPLRLFNPAEITEITLRRRRRDA